MSASRHLRVVTNDAWTDLEAQAEALDWRCPYCDVDAGETCVNLRTGDAMRASHWQRISAAREDASESEKPSRMS